jgi:hypothetical protein
LASVKPTRFFFCAVRLAIKPENLFRAATFANLIAPARAGDCQLRLAIPG